MLRELIFSSARTFQHRLASRWPGRQGFHPLADLFRCAQSVSSSRHRFGTGTSWQLGDRR